MIYISCHGSGESHRNQNRTESECIRGYNEYQRERKMVFGLCKHYAREHMMNQFRTNDFLDKLVQDTTNKNTFLEGALDEFETIRADKLQNLRQLFWLKEIDDAYAVNISYQEAERFSAGDIDVVKYAVKIADTLIMPAYVTCPENDNGKAVLYLHGHDALGARGAVVINEDKKPYHKNIPLQMTRVGFRVVIPELLGLGEAAYEYLLKGQPALGGCFFNYAFLTLCGYDLTGVRVWQTIKIMDFMQLLGWNADIIFGVSGGGLVCELASVLDDRVQNIIISSYVNTYEDSILAKEQCIDNYIHGINRLGNSYELLALAAPKRMLLLNGNADRPFPLAGTQKAFAYMQEIYRKYHAENRLQCSIFDGRHEINSDIVLEWLRQF